MKNNYFKILTATALITSTANAAEIDRNTARMQAMDKITGRVSVINIPVNGALNFGSLSIVVRSCKSRPAEEAPENFAFVDITDKSLQGEEYNIFKGWMISSSPATNAVEHPIYDVWLLRCLDSEADKSLILTEQQLKERDSIPMEKQPLPTKEKAESKTSQTQPQITEPMTEMPAETPEETFAIEPVEEQVEFVFDEEDENEDENAPLNIAD